MSRIQIRRYLVPLQVASLVASLSGIVCLQFGATDLAFVSFILGIVIAIVALAIAAGATAQSNQILDVGAGLLCVMTSLAFPVWAWIAALRLFSGLDVIDACFAVGATDTRTIEVSKSLLPPGLFCWIGQPLPLAATPAETSIGFTAAFLAILACSTLGILLMHREMRKSSASAETAG